MRRNKFYYALSLGRYRCRSSPYQHCCILLYGFALRNMRMTADRRLLWIAFAIAIPLQPLVFYLIRIPLDYAIQWQFGSSSTTYAFLKTWFAPVTEELAKLIPLLVPAIFRDVSKSNFVRYALAIGFGFAIGEMWFVAERISREPAIGNLPFYQFGGYIGERLMTCIFHSAFVAVGLSQLRGRWIVGIGGAFLLHWFTNLPIFLMAWDVGGLGKDTWSAIVVLLLTIELFAALGLLAYLSLGRMTMAHPLYGSRKCPECAAIYHPPLLALNVFQLRYERCPSCCHWHWTRPSSASDQAPSDTP